jgi:hypothetical protein
MVSSSEEVADQVLRPLAAKLASPVSVFAVAGATPQRSSELVTLALLPLDSEGRIDVSAAVQGPSPVPQQLQQQQQQQ